MEKKFKLATWQFVEERLKKTLDECISNFILNNKRFIKILDIYSSTHSCTREFLFDSPDAKYQIEKVCRIEIGENLMKFLTENKDKCIIPIINSYWENDENYIGIKTYRIDAILIYFERSN